MPDIVLAGAYTTCQGCMPIAVIQAFDGPDPAAKLLEMIIRSLDADGDGDMEDHEVIAAREKIARHQSTANLASIDNQ